MYTFNVFAYPMLKTFVPCRTPLLLAYSTIAHWEHGAKCGSTHSKKEQMNRVLKTTEVLLAAGADANIADVRGMTAKDFVHAMNRGGKESPEQLRSFGVEVDELKEAEARRVFHVGSLAAVPGALACDWCNTPEAAELKICAKCRFAQYVSARSSLVL
jgi:hypothetical protein